MRGLRILSGALCVLCVSCVTYDFEPVNPYAISVEFKDVEAIGRVPPNVMLVIDKSGSMDLPMNPALSSCGSCGTSKANLCNPATCPTRWSELQSAMNAFLPSTNGDLRLGLVTYPSNNVCGAPGSVRLPLPTYDDAAGLSAYAVSINNEIQNITSSGAGGTANSTGGGTPTAQALQILVNDRAFVPNDARPDVVVLLTDGLPNCNANNPNSWTSNPTACRCTLGTDCSAYPREGCLDDTGTLTVIQALRSRDITVAVVGFGAEVTSGPGPDVLRALAAAGGFKRACQAASDCATGDACNNGLCSSGLFLPTNSAELADALRKIGPLPDPCVNQISEPADPRTVEVLVGARKLAPPEWQLNGYTLTINGAACQALRDATPDRKVNLQIRVLREVGG